MPTQTISRRRGAGLAAIGLVGALALAGSATANAASDRGPGHDRRPVVDRLFTETNDASGNRVQVIDVGPRGGLRLGRSFPTGGLGTSAGLGNQGAVALEGRWLLAVNAGSDELSLFRVRRRSLSLVDVVPSGGDSPVSVATDGRRAYVVHSGSSDVTGFDIGRDGRLTQIAAATQPLSTANAGPAEVEITPDGRSVVVTEKATNVIATFPVAHDGGLGGGTFTPSAGQTPFGFAVDHRGRLFVSEAFGGAPNASSVSSYAVLSGGGVAPITPLALSGQTAACWVVLSDNERFAYATNTGSNTLTGYRIARDGTLTLLDADGVSGHTGDGPIDAAVEDRDLYTLNARDDTITGFRMRHDGSLRQGDTLTGLPPDASGLVAD